MLLYICDLRNIYVLFIMNLNISGSKKYIKLYKNNIYNNSDNIFIRLQHDKNDKNIYVEFEMNHIIIKKNIFFYCLS
jgi:hypothetical protein